MSELYSLIKKSQIKDLDSVEIICSRFAPLIKKYAHMLRYEDAYNDLQLCLIECIYKVPLNNGKFNLSDAYILSYIKKSVYFGYIALSQKSEKYKYKNVFYDNYEYKVDKISYKEDMCLMEDALFLTDIKRILNVKEYELFRLKFIEQYTDSEIAKIFGISRQAVNKRINKMKKKLWEYYKNKV